VPESVSINELPHAGLIEPPGQRRLSRRWVNTGFLIAIGCLACVAIASCLCLVRLSWSGAWVSHTQQITYELEALLSTLGEAGRSESSYIITGDASLLEPSLRASAEIPARLEHLTAMTGDNLEQQSRLQTLGRLVAQRLEVLATITRTRSEQGFDAARAAFAEGDGKRLDVRLRGAIDEMKRIEIALLRDREHRATVNTWNAQFAIVSGSLLALALVAGAWLAVSRDAAARRRAEEVTSIALAEARELYNTAPCGYHSLDAGGIVQSINDTELRWLGYERSEVVGRVSFVLLLTPESREHLRPALETLDLRASIPSIELVMVRKDGSRFPVLVSTSLIRDESGLPRSWRMTVFDLTELRRAEAERDRAFAMSPDILVVANSSGRFTDANQAVTHVLGWTPDQFMARPFLEFVHPEDRERTAAEYALQLSEGKVVVQFENRYLHRDGSWRVLSWRSTPAPGGIVFATARDVTESKRREQEIRQLNTRLVHQSRQLAESNAELEAFSYSVSHDLRAPLRSIAGFAQVLVEDCGPQLGTEGRDALDRVVNATKRMGQLIDDLLSLSRVSRGELHREDVDLGAMAREIASSLAGEFPERTVEFIAGEDLHASADPRLMRVVLENLLRNAWKFTSKLAGKARVEIGRTREGEFFVKDNGAGFDMAYANKLFGAFQRLHTMQDFQGTGIGLATAKRIIHRHGGEVRARGAVGEGATFFFSLPADDAPVSADSQTRDESTLQGVHNEP
jgi:PAS domain S-box-containing protein